MATTWYSPSVLYKLTIIANTIQGELNAPEAVIRCQSASTLSPSLSLPTCIRMTPSSYGLVTSIFAFGGLLGALAGGPMGNKFGRRGSLLICSIGFAIGGFVMTIAPSVFVLALGRTISGLASGAAVVVAPLYVHDLAPAESKGSYGALTQISVNVGILLTQTLGLFLSESPPPSSMASVRKLMWSR